MKLNIISYFSYYIIWWKWLGSIYFDTLPARQWKKEKNTERKMGKIKKSEKQKHWNKRNEKSNEKKTEMRNGKINKISQQKNPTKKLYILILTLRKHTLKSYYFYIQRKQTLRTFVFVFVCVCEILLSLLFYIHFYKKI